VRVGEGVRIFAHVMCVRGPDSIERFISSCSILPLWLNKSWGLHDAAHF
jgi:hypothetical protein